MNRVYMPPRLDIAEYAARNEHGDVTTLTDFWVVLTKAGKTKAWAIVAKKYKVQVAEVVWFGDEVRSYVLNTNPGVGFGPNSLREIADFIEARNEERRQRKPVKP